MYSNRKERDFNTPFWTFSSGTLYSFMSAGSTVKGEHVSATIAIATVVHTLFCLSWTFKLFSSVANTSWGLEDRTWKSMSMDSVRIWIKLVKLQRSGRDTWFSPHKTFRELGNKMNTKHETLNSRTAKGFIFIATFFTLSRLSFFPALCSSSCELCRVAESPHYYSDPRGNYRLL